MEEEIEVTISATKDHFDRFIELFDALYDGEELETEEADFLINFRDSFQTAITNAS